MQRHTRPLLRTAWHLGSSLDEQPLYFRRAPGISSARAVHEEVRLSLPVWGRHRPMNKPIKGAGSLSGMSST